jgi:S-DNA-T family DNA segregation ATPase FtsK/SpoIIIE
LKRWALSNAVPFIDPIAAQDSDTKRLLRFADGLVAVDDCDLLIDSPLDETIARVIAARRCAVLVTVRADDLLVSFRGIAFEMRRSRSGLLLQPNIADGEPFGITISSGPPSPLPGRGVLITDPLRVTNPNGLPIQVVADAC